ncbi:hypothetical protein [Massilia sp. BJB1822]|uniref:hypothetical protein n=1 Tax=Massilia sp. BJB1822 TaxID=2744470 RepID=UPI001C3E7FFE|nr:hypothetical protein [Massilia sp. BJB1822]
MDDKIQTLKITDYLAIYAALLSSVVFLWNLVQSRPRIKVNVLFGVETIDGVTTSGVFVVVRNTSSHDIHLGAIGILYPYREAGAKERLLHFWRYKRWPKRVGWCHTSLSNYAIKDGCPMCLEARKSHHVLVPKEIVEKILSGATQATLIVKVQDQLWNDVYSKPFKWPQLKRV